MHIRDLDLNLLRIFDAVYRQRSVSRAAEVLGLSQPAVSQALSRLRLVMKDALFTRVGRGVAPTANADALAHAVQQALHLVGEALHGASRFDPATAQRTFRLHMSDIGESEFLPALMHEVRRLAPEVRIETRQLEYAQIENALDSGTIDAAFGYLPGVEHSCQQRLFMERYVVLARAAHPLLAQQPTPRQLAQLDYVVVRQHTETLRLLDRMQLQGRIRLSTPHFMVIPAILRETDLAVLLPMRIATKFALAGQLCFVQPRWAVADFGVGLHWSQRAQNDPAHQWLRALAIRLFREPGTAGAVTAPRRSASPRRSAA